MRDEILALLEDGAHSTAELAGWLEQPQGAVLQALTALETDGAVTRTGTLKQWALTTYRPASLVDAEDGLRTLNQATTVAILAQYGPQTVAALAKLLNVNQWTLRDRLAWWRTSGTITLARRGRAAAIVSLPGAPPQLPAPIGRPRVHRRPPEPAADAETMRQVTEVAVALARQPADGPAVRIIDGQEYEVVFDGTGPLTPWPEDARGSSTLCGQTFGVKR